MSNTLKDMNETVLDILDSTIYAGGFDQNWTIYEAELNYQGRTFQISIKGANYSESALQLALEEDLEDPDISSFWDGGLALDPRHAGDQDALDAIDACQDFLTQEMAAIEADLLEALIEGAREGMSV